jgi:hypothetical protein
MRAALALGIAADAAGQFGHHAARLHAAGQHVAVVAIAGDALVAFLGRGLQADDDRFLPDVEVAEAADQAHAVKLAGLFLESADQQHVAVIFQQLVLGKGERLAQRASGPYAPPGPDRSARPDSAAPPYGSCLLASSRPS